MAKSSQSSSGVSSSGVGGGGQVVVELCDLSGHGLVFWSRQRFEVCTEVQLRVRAAVLPMELREAGRLWVMLRGIVVQSLAERRGDGSCGFRVCLLVVGNAESGAMLEAEEELFVRHDWLGGRRMGLN